MPDYLLAVDQGTTSTRAIVFNADGKSCASHQQEFKQYYPHDGWVEHSPEEIWQTTLACMREAIAKANLRPDEIHAMGISNQRETAIIWDRNTGVPIFPAIVWQDRRSAAYCQLLHKQERVTEQIIQKTGLVVDPYFSATKIVWLLDHVPEARKKAECGELAFGTVDTFLLWRLTGGYSHKTDATNASRTLLFNIHTQQWDDELLSLFGIPKSLLPEVCDNAALFGVTQTDLLGAAIPITGMAGDQQAATVGQACFRKGMIKSTYGTGCFLLLNTGDKVVRSANCLLSTVAYRIQGKVTYGLEGSIFIAGAAVQWLRDALHLIHNAKETESIAKSIADTGGVYLVPAFTGLGAPYWDPLARGALIGLTRDSGIQHIVRAALEAVCYQTKDLMLAMQQDYSSDLAILRVDGGMVANDWLLQFLADMLDLEVQRPQCIETSALGAAMLAALGVGIYHSLEDIAKHWQLDQCFKPSMSSAKREQLYQGWLTAVRKVCAQD